MSEKLIKNFATFRVKKDGFWATFVMVGVKTPGRKTSSEEKMGSKNEGAKMDFDVLNIQSFQCIFFGSLIHVAIHRH